MAENKGHWYTDAQGNHYFVEEGQSPKEGWEASKRRKMIKDGKYQVSDDGNDYREVDQEEYSNYESDESDFDENSEDDFGFDEEDDFERDFNEMKDSGVNVEDPREVMEYLGANMGLDREDQVAFMERMGYTVDDIERLRNPDDNDEFDDTHLSYEEVFTDNDNAQIEKYAEHYGVDASELKDAIHQKALDYIREGDSITNAKDDAMESILEDVASGEYNKEMQKAQEQNANMRENEPEEPKNENEFPNNITNYTPAIRKNPNGEFEVDRDGNNTWEVIDEEEYNALKQKGVQEIEYEEEPAQEEDLEGALTELINLVPDDQKEKAKELLNKLVPPGGKA